MKYSLQALVRENSLFFLLFALLMLSGLLWTSLMPKGALILWFSEHRTYPGNLFFTLATRGGEVIGFFLALVVLFQVHKRWVLALGLMTLAVSLVSNLTKSILQQPRPARYFREQGVWQEIEPVPGVVLHEGLTSLPSGHTMAAFAFFALMAFCIKDKRIMAGIAFSLALFTGISRIYLVQHFEEDVLLGAPIGVALAMLFYALFKPVAAQEA